MNWFTCFGGGTRRGKAGVGRKVGNSSGGCKADAEGCSGGISISGSTTTISSVATSSNNNLGSSSLPIPKTKSSFIHGGGGGDTSRKFTSEAAKRLSDTGRKSTYGGKKPGVADAAKNTDAGKKASDVTVAAARKAAGENSSGSSSAKSVAESSGNKRVRSASSSSSNNNKKDSPSSNKRHSAGLYGAISRSRGVTSNSTSNLSPKAVNHASPRVASVTRSSTITGQLGPRDTHKADGVAKGSRYISRTSVPKTGATNTATVGQRSGGRTATVTPSEVAFKKRSTKPLTRFGFTTDAPVIKSGESTDSVNSILSDAITGSDSNSNLLEYFDEHAGTAEKLEDLHMETITKQKNVKNNLFVVTNVCAEGGDQVNDGRSGSSSRCDDIIVHSPCSPKSPTTISQASSGITSASNVIIAKLKTQTKHLPEPQIPALTSYASSRKSSSQLSARSSEADAGKKIDSLSSPSFTSQIASFQPQNYRQKQPSSSVSSCPATFKPVTNASSSKSCSATSSPVNEKDTESPKSVNTLDSGLGSSMEGDKLKAASNGKSVDNTSEYNISIEQKSNEKKKSPVEEITALQEKLKIGEKLYSNHDLLSFESNGTSKSSPKNTAGSTPDGSDESMKASVIDDSDKWLREKKNKMGRASKLQTGSALKPSALTVTNLKKMTVTPKAKEPVSDCKPQSVEESTKNSKHINYVATRQKFAIYDRNRFGFQLKTENVQSDLLKTTKTNLSKTPSDPGKKLPFQLNPSSTKLSRVQSIPTIGKTPSNRPTSLIKTPILVTPVSNETVEISRPILKKLEYTEGESSNGTDGVNSDRIRHRKNSAEDLLMVASIEMQLVEPPPPLDEVKNSIKLLEREVNSSVDCRRDIEFNKKLNHKSIGAATYSVLESPASETVGEDANPNEINLDSPSISHLNSKLMSPDSENSYEVLDTPSEDVDYMDPSACTEVLCQDDKEYSEVSSPSNNDALVSDSDSDHRDYGNVLQQPQSSIVGSSQVNVPNYDENQHYNKSETVSSEAYAAEIELLTNSLEKSSLVESLADAIMTDALKLSATAIISTDMDEELPATYTNNPSAFYNIAATSSTSSSDLDHDNHYVNDSSDLNLLNNINLCNVENRTINQVAEDMSDSDEIKFMNDLNNSKGKHSDSAKDLLRNTIEETENVSKISDTNFISYEEISTLQSNTTCNETDTKIVKVSTFEPEGNQNCFIDTTTAVSSTKNSDPSSVDLPTTNYDEINSTSMMSTSSAFSESNLSDRFTPTLRTSFDKSRETTNLSNGNTNSTDMDQDFLIDDEICDQPDLTFGGEEMCCDRAELAFGAELSAHRDYRQRTADNISSAQRDFLYRGETFSLNNRKKSSCTTMHPESGQFIITDDLVTNELLQRSEHQRPFRCDGQPYDAVHHRDDVVSSLFSDEGVYGEDMQVPSPCHAIRRIGKELQRNPSGELSEGGGSLSTIYSGGSAVPAFDHRTAARSDSVCTLASSLDPDDFMLDFDVDDFSSNNRCVTPSSSPLTTNNIRHSGISSGNNSRHCSPHSGNSATNYSGLKRSLVSLTRGGETNGKPTRLPVLKQHSDGEHGGSPSALPLERALQQHLLQDCQTTKTMLLKLRAILLQADNLGPFDQSAKHAIELESAILSNGSAEASNSGADYGVSDNENITAGGGLTDQHLAAAQESAAPPYLLQQNTDLRRQVFLLQQQLDERDRAMRTLQQKLKQQGGGDSAVAVDARMTKSFSSVDVEQVKNAATQTDRNGRATTLIRPPSVDDGLGPTVSSEDCNTSNSGNSSHRSSRLSSPSTCVDTAVPTVNGTRRSSSDAPSTIPTPSGTVPTPPARRFSSNAAPSTADAPSRIIMRCRNASGDNILSNASRVNRNRSISCSNTANNNSNNPVNGHVLTNGVDENDSLSNSRTGYGSTSAPRQSPNHDASYKFHRERKDMFSSVSGSRTLTTVPSRKLSTEQPT